VGLQGFYFWRTPIFLQIEFLAVAEFLTSAWSHLPEIPGAFVCPSFALLFARRLPVLCAFVCPSFARLPV
jgi:hypothetical protein